MPVELKVPSVGESVTEVEIGEWLKEEGDEVKEGDELVMLDSAKATMAVYSPVSGVISKILVTNGEPAAIGDTIAQLEEGASAKKTENKSTASPGKEAEPPRKEQEGHVKKDDLPVNDKENPRVMPAAARVLAENNLGANAVEATGPGGRVLKEDVQRHLDEPKSNGASPQPPTPDSQRPAEADEEIVRMSLLRHTIGQTLVQAQQTAALLTTFNEIDMTAVMALRKQYQEEFVKKNEIKLGFMSFFTKAVVEALKAFPAVNAEVRERNIVYRNHYDIGVAIGSGKGLVVPVIRRAERLSFAEIEQAITDYAKKVKENKIAPDDLSGGTFTITNGGIYGSLLSTPIVNPPQSGILGMHSIQDRPMAINGEVVIRPMMYVALTYDHRIVDGREAVSFLVKIKQCIEDPARMLLEV